jgi:hypothetical protein
MAFFSTSRQISEQQLKLGHDRFLPHPFQFIILYFPVIRRYTVLELLTPSLNRLQINIQIFKSVDVGPSELYIFNLV